jgi:hypothetical protein
MAAGLVKSSLKITVNKALIFVVNAPLNFSVNEGLTRRQAAISA